MTVLQAWNLGNVVRLPTETRFCSAPKRPNSLWGHTSHLLSGTEVSFPGVKVHEPEADHTPPQSGECMNTNTYVFTFLIPQWRGASLSIGTTPTYFISFNIFISRLMTALLGRSK